MTNVITLYYISFYGKFQPFFDNFFYSISLIFSPKKLFYQIKN